MLCCMEGECDKLGPLRCRDCGELAHRKCLGLRSLSLLSCSYTCRFCDAWRVWEGGNPALLAAERASAEITTLEAEALEESTVATYHYRLNVVRKWAASQGFHEDDIFPQDPRQGMHHLVALGVLAHGSRVWAESYLDGIKTAMGAWHADKGLPNPMELPRAKALLKAAKKRALRLGHFGTGPKAPVSKELLAVYLTWLDLEARTRPKRREMCWRDAAWAALGFHGLLRRSELGALNLEDISLEPQLGRIRVLIRRSKTDSGRGQTVWLAWVTQSGTRLGDIISRWIDARRARGAQPGDALFTAWDKAAETMTGAPLRAKDALSLQFKRQLKRMADAIRLELKVDEYSAHSLRRGGANAMKEFGATAREIQEHGRWSSDCYLRYLERTSEERLSLTARM